MSAVAACAHLRVKYTTKPVENGGVEGWWECDLCRTRFAPLLGQRMQHIPTPVEAGHVVGLAIYRGRCLVACEWALLEFEHSDPKEAGTFTHISYGGVAKLLPWT